MESIDIIHYLKTLYEKTLWLFLAGVLAAYVAFTISGPTRHQAGISIKLSKDSAAVFAQNRRMTAVRSQDIRPDLKGLGLVKMVFRQKPGQLAYMDIVGQAPSVKKAERLTAEAARVFLKRSRRLDAGPRRRGAGLTEILGRAEPAGPVERDRPQRTAVAAVVGILIAAVAATIVEQLKQTNGDAAATKPAMQPVAK